MIVLTFINNKELTPNITRIKVFYYQTGDHVIELFYCQICDYVTELRITFTSWFYFVVRSADSSADRSLTSTAHTTNNQINILSIFVLSYLYVVQLMVMSAIKLLSHLISAYLSQNPPTPRPSVLLLYNRVVLNHEL